MTWRAVANPFDTRKPKAARYDWQVKTKAAITIGPPSLHNMDAESTRGFGLLPPDDRPPPRGYITRRFRCLTL